MNKSFLFLGLILSTLTALQAQPVPGVCRVFRQNYQGPGNRILNNGTALVSGVAPLPTGSPGVVEISAGPNTDQPAGPGGAIPANHTIYKVSVAVSLNHPRAGEIDIMLGYNAPTFTAPNTWAAGAQTPGPQTRWVTLSTDNGGDLTWSLPSFDDDADPGLGIPIDFPTPQVNNNFTVSRDFANATGIQTRIIPEEPLSQLAGMPATGAGGQGGVFFIAVRDDTPAPAGSVNATFDGSLGGFTVTLITIPTIEYGGTYPVGQKYTNLTTQSGLTLGTTNPASGVRTSDVFTSGPNPDSIYNNATVTKTLVATGLTGRTIMDVDVRVALRHTFLGDLAMSLTSPQGTTVTLMNRRGGNIDWGPSPSYLNAAAPAQPATFAVPADQRSATGHVIFPSIIFSDESDSTTVNTTSMFGNTINSQATLTNFGALVNASAGIEANDNTITDQDYQYSPSFPYASAGATNPRGFFQFTPEEGLGAFRGEDPRGTWTLKITDNNGRDAGSLDRFEVRIGTIPKPCILDVGASGTAGCSPADSVGSVSINVCSNQYPLDGEFIKVDTVFGHNTPPGIGAFLVGTNIQAPLGTTVFSAGSRNTALSNNPRVIYKKESFTIDAVGTPLPDPAVNAQQLTIQNVKKLIPFFSPPPIIYPNTLPRHGYRMIPRVPAQQSYCRWPARTPVTAGAPADLDQNPTDSVGLSTGNRPPDAVCKDRITITLDTAANAGIAIVKPYDLEVTGASSDDCTKRGSLQFLSLGNRIGANLANNTECTTLGTYLINFDNANNDAAYSGANSCPVVSPATNNVKILESLAAVSGKTPDNAFLVRINRQATSGGATLSTIAAQDIKATLKYQMPNGSIVTRTYANTAAVAPPATGAIIVPLALSPGTQLISPLAVVKDVSVQTKVTLTAGKISNIGFEFGTLVRDSLRFTTLPRTVTCADIGKPTKVMLVVKDRSDNVDSCYVNVTVLDGKAPTITCGTDVVQTLPTVSDCSWYLTNAQVLSLAPRANDDCLPLTSVSSPLQRSNSIAPGIAFMIENTTAAPIVVESLNFPVLAPRDMFIRAYIMPVNLTTAGTQIDQTTYPSSAQYPVLHQATLGVPANWIFWGQNIIQAQTPGTISEVEFRPKNYSNLTLSLGTTSGPPYATSGNPDIGASLIIPAGQRYGVYLAMFGVDANGYPVPAANNTTFGIVHSNVANGGVVVSAPYPLPSVAAQLPPVIIRGGWNTTNPNIGNNEFEGPGFPQVQNPAVPPFTPAIYEGVVNFPLAHQLLGAPVPVASQGGSVRMFAGKVNYIPAMVPAPTAPTGNNIFVLPSQKPSGSIPYYQKTPVFTPGVFTPNTPRAIYTYDGIKLVSGVDPQKPFPIGKTVNVYQVTDRAGNTATCSQTIEIKPAPGAVPPVLVCQDFVSVSLDGLCSDTLRANEFLANATNAKCLGAFRIELLSGTNVIGVQTGSYAGTPFRDLIGKTYDYRVIDAANTGNFCTGKVKFEDKFPPKVVCPDNITVDDCSADLATSPTLVYTQTYTNPSNFTSNFTQGLGISSAAIPVNAPKGAKVLSVKVATSVTLTPNVTLSRLFYNLITPSGGLIQLASQPGLIDNGFNGIACGPFANNTIVRYNFNDQATQAPLVVASGYPCPPPNGTYLPMDALNDNLVGIDAEGDWFIQFQEAAINNTYTGQGALLAGANDLKLIITMSVPIESATVQEYCTLNLVPQLAESVKTNTCTQDTSIVKVIKRTYSAKDAAGNLGTCSHTVSFKRAKFRDEVYPSDIVLDCTYNNLKSNPADQDAIDKAIAAGAQISPAYRGPWFDSNGNPHPNVVGRPRPFTCTSYSVGYTDMRIDNICGTGNGSFAVRRTWKVYDACVNKAVTYEQYISVQDIVSPTITATADQTISPPVGQCTATLTIPVPDVSDNCNASSDLNIVYELYSNSNLTIPAGSQSPVAPNKFDNISPSPVNNINGTITEDWYYVKYTVTDKCGNTATATSRIKVTDRVAPVAICPPLVKVALTSDGSAFMRATEFDRGSYDNCGGISKYQVWRLDEGDCVSEDVNQNGFLNDDIDVDNDGFGDYPEFDFYKHPQSKVKFCCSDIGDTVMVVFRVWDNSPILGRNQFRPTDPNYDYGVGNRGNVNICMTKVVVEDKLPPVVATQDTAVVCGSVVTGKNWLDQHTPQPQLPTTGFGEYNKFTYFSDNQQYDIKNGITSIKFPVKGLNGMRNLDLNVKLNFYHNNIGNLFAELVSPAGTKVSLFKQPKSRIGSVPYLSSGADANNPFALTFDDEPSLTPADYVQFTAFDDLGISGTDVNANDVSSLSRKYVSIDQLATIEKEKLDGIWTLNIGKISPFIDGEGKVLERGVSLELQGYPLATNIFSSKDAAAVFSHPDSLTTFVTIPVSGIDTIQDLNVALKFHHTNIGNLSATLTSPAGTTVELFVQPTSQNGAPYLSPQINGNPTTNIFSLSFNDEPSVNPNFLPQFSSLPGVGDTITPATLGLVNGTYLGLGQFNAFDGQNANGNWLLTITRLDPTLPDSGLVVAGGAQLQIASNRSGYNTSYLFDNCSDFTLACKDSVGINNCGTGYIKRTWTLSDAGGRTASDDQYYRTTGTSHYSVVFPKDTVLTCLSGSTDTSYTGKPVISYLGGCPVVATGYNDEYITAVNSACYRIKRTWKVANLCQSGMMKGIGNDVALMAATLPNRTYVNNSQTAGSQQGAAPNVDNDGYVEYIQFINVNDKTPPVIANAPTSIKLEPFAKECKVNITIPRISVSDVCSDKIDTSWSIINKSTLAVVRTGVSLPATHTFGSADFGTTFIVEYKMTDRCGNYAFHKIEVTPKDIVKPTPVCYQGLSADLLPTTGNVMLMAPQFDAGSFDGNNCTATANLKVRIERGTPGFSTFTVNADNQVILPAAALDMVSIDCKGVVPIRLWVTDAAGNSDYCDTYVDVQNNMGANAADCPAVPVTGNRILVTLTTLKNQTVKNADVNVEASSGVIAARAIGNDYVADVPLNQTSPNLKISAEKIDNPMNGVSTYDLVMMTKHILALQPINSPFLKIAADVNNNGTISTSDVVELRKMILAIQTGFKNNKSWRFFTNDMKEKPEFDNPLRAQIVNFTGIKIGDINLSANSASPKTTGTLQFDVNEKLFVAGEEVRATFNAADIANIEGYQFTLGYDKETLELVNIEGNPENFGMVESGSVTSSWNGTAQNGENLFTLVFRAKKAGNLSEMLNINSKFTNAEAYTKSGEYNNVSLKFNGARDRFALYQNQPNPFMGRTVVGFNLPKAEHAKMTIFDIAGRVLKTVEGDFSKGYNEVIIDEILGSGVLNYKLETATETATKSMIILE